MSQVGGSDNKESACNRRDLNSVHESGESAGEGNDYPAAIIARECQYYFLGNPMHRGAWWGTVSKNKMDR